MEFGPATFGELNADDYDALHDPGTTEESVALIAELAGKGRILELAIGTGRMALPLKQRGHDISGIEGSPAMVAKLREKPGGADIPVVIGYQRVRITTGGTRLVPLKMRYAWPQEIDLMANLAGLERAHRWGGWQREPFTAKSEMHVSVYRKPS